MGYLTSIFRELQSIRADVSSLDKQVLSMHACLRRLSGSANVRGTLEENLKSALFSLPDRLRRTVIAVKDLGGKVTAADVSNVTGRTRAIESKHLNELTILGWMTKDSIRRNRHVYFSLAVTEVKT